MSEKTDKEKLACFFARGIVEIEQLGDLALANSIITFAKSHGIPINRSLAVDEWAPRTGTQKGVK
jgi:type III secretion system FlhB-like substrate exporter